MSTLPTNEIEILHYPIRSLSQFERKIRDGARALMANTRISPEVGNTWRKLYRDYVQQGTLATYYNSLIPDADQLVQGIADGRLINDLRMLNALTKN